ncbi:MAG: peptidase Ste24p, partial [Verrucomicrobia bacterium]|nr:peptidase Ste24p [Verrucomicrobiota bacterium]
MDFFEAQARAKKRTSRLVTLFVFAVVGTIAAGYFASILLLSQASTRAHRSRRYAEYESYQQPTATISWWQPKILFGVTIGTFVVVGLASLYKWNEFSSGGAAVAESVGGRAVNPHTTDLKERRLLNVVEEMAIASGIPMPTVYVLDNEPAINAFAAGLTTNDAVVAVTRGTIDKLTRDELQGVIGHEFSHILNGDMRLNLQLG